MKEYTAIRADDKDYGEMSVCVGRGVLAHMSRAGKDFIRRAKAGAENSGFPKFKSARRWSSIEIDDPNPGMVSRKKGCVVVKIKGLPVLKLRPKRDLPDSKMLKRVIVKRALPEACTSTSFTNWTRTVRFPKPARASASTWA